MYDGFATSRCLLDIIILSARLTFPISFLSSLIQVRSVDQQTKLLCIIALSNLLDETTVDYMLDEVRTNSYLS